jgi:hypothetical protein
MILEIPHCTEFPHLLEVLYYQREQSFQDLPLACGNAGQAR